MSRLGIELLSVFGMPPVEHVTLAADLGCSYISTGLTQLPFNPHGYPAWSLLDDAALRKELIAAMRDLGVSIGLGEGLIIRPDVEMRDCAPQFDIMAELGARNINAVSMDPDLSRTYDQIAISVEMAEQRGMDSVIEFAPALASADLNGALAAIRHVGKPNFRLLIDSMHLIRSGGTPDDLVALDRDLIGYAQLSDAPLTPSIANYMEEATFNRLAPGEGALPLFDIIAALPRHIILSLEVPMLTAAEAGIGPIERLGPCVESVRGFLARLDSEDQAG